MIGRLICRALACVLRCWVRYQIWETEHYLRDCERDGLVESLSLTDFRAQLAALRVRLAALQPPIAAAASSVLPRLDGAPDPAEACTELGEPELQITVRLPRTGFLHALALVTVIEGVAVYA